MAAMDRWTFECCNDKQLLRLSWVGTFTMLIICTWRTPLAYPYKLFAYFTHESFRAATATLTCGQVDAIDIHPEEGSETSFHCGISFLVHVAGYLGSLCLGCLFIASSATDTPRLVCGGAVVLQLVAFTAFSNTRYLRTVHALSLAAALAAGVVAYVVHVSEVVELFVLLAGVVHAMLYIADASCNGARIHPSDFSLCRKTYGLPVALVGVVFASVLVFIAVLLQVSAVGLRGGPPVSSVHDLTTPTAVSLVVFMTVVAVAVASSAVKCFCTSISVETYVMGVGLLWLRLVCMLYRRTTIADHMGDVILADTNVGANFRTGKIRDNTCNGLLV